MAMPIFDNYATLFDFNFGAALAVGLLVGFLWSYEVLSLWDSPWLTAWIIIGYFIGAFVIDSCFRGASFCKYVCPIGQFHFVQSLASPREVRIRSASVCNTCSTHDCIKGNEQYRGCELDLFQPRKNGNMDCTFCLDCVRACPHDNVGLLRAVERRQQVEAHYRLGEPWRGGRYA